MILLLCNNEGSEIGSRLFGLAFNSWAEERSGSSFCRSYLMLYDMQTHYGTRLTKSLHVLLIRVPGTKLTFVVSEDPEAEVLVVVDSATHHQRQRKHAAAVFAAAE